MTHRWQGLGMVAALALAGCGLGPTGSLPDGLVRLDPLEPIASPAVVAPSVPVGSPGHATPAPLTPSPAPGAASPSPVSTPPVPTSGSFDALEAYILQSSNSERAKVGARPLSSDDRLHTLARSRSQDMVDRNYFSHTNPDGKLVFDLLKAMGFAYSTAGENIAMNNYPVDQTAVQTMQGWMNSPGHKANILNTSYGRIGVGAAKRASDGSYYYTQVFTN